LGFTIIGTGRQRTIFDLTSVTPPGGTGLIQISDSHPSPNQFFGNISNVGFLGNTPGPVLQIGDNGLTQIFNSLDFEQIWISNLDTSSSAIGAKLNYVINSRFDIVCNCSGHGSALELNQVQGCELSGLYGTADTGIYFTNGNNFGNLFKSVETTSVGICIVNDSTTTGANLFSGGVYSYSDFLISNSAGNNWISIVSPNIGGGTVVDPSNYQWISIKGVDLSSTPSVPATTVPATNLTGNPMLVQIWVASGNTADITNTNIYAGYRSRNINITQEISASTGGATVWLDPGDAITLTYTGANVEWLWRCVL
jgi:hypothetical protein